MNEDTTRVGSQKITPFIEEIAANKITTVELNADRITTGTLKADRVDIEGIIESTKFQGSALLVKRMAISDDPGSGAELGVFTIGDHRIGRFSTTINGVTINYLG